jgi:hypothetical protein
LLSDQKEKKKREIFINVKRKRMLSARFRIKKNKKDEDKRDKRQGISLCNYYFKNI